MARHRPITPKRVVSFGKVLKIRFTSKRKEVRASEVKKGVKKTRLGVGLVSNSSFLNRDVGITGGDSELRQANPHVNCLVCLLVFLLSKLLE
jgi:hypothetical protein